VWEDRNLTTELNKKLKLHTNLKNSIDSISSDLELVSYTLESIITDADNIEDDNLINEMIELHKKASIELDKLSFRQLFKGENDYADAYIDIQSGSGGTEAQDWVAMIMRMYLKWTEKHSFDTEITESSEGDVAGFKNVTIKVNGDHAYGWLRTETGVHRLVRKSPFDSGNRRHTSFASVFIYPQVDDSFEIDINPSDLRIDVYRASGAGGQHVNTTESAVRITHLPTKLVVQCQNGRSQHKNKESAMKQLRAKLYAYELNKKNEIKNQIESEKSDISWGNQIRSYVLDDSRIKDLRTNYETGNTQSVLDGNLDDFIQESLKRGF
jgi:peptide chain release factor 2